MPEKHELKIGGIVAKATLVDIVEKSNDPFYADGCFGWVLDNVKPVKFAPVIGKLVSLIRRGRLNRHNLAPG